MSLYGEYIKERENKHIIENEYSFVTFEIKKPYIYLGDMYIKPEYRGEKESHKLADKVAEVGKESGCTHMMTSICTIANNWGASERVIDLYGFKFFREDVLNHMIYYIKEI